MSTPSAEYTTGVSVTRLVFQCFVICAVFAMWTSPIIQPVKIMVVLLHEMSHGLMALLTGGQVVSIAITQSEGGLCETEGGIVALIVSAGYLGSMLFGGFLLYFSKFKESAPIVYTVLTLTLAAAIFTVLRDPFSRTFATGLAATFIFLGLLAPPFLSSLVLQVLGTISCLYSIFDIYGDVLLESSAGNLENDAQVFAQITGVPPNVVGVSWLAVSVIYFAFVLRFFVFYREVPKPEREKK